MDEELKVVAEKPNVQPTTTNQIRKRTAEERARQTIENRTHIFTIIFRNLKNNVDLVILAGVVFVSVAFGYCLCLMLLSFSVNEIKIGLRNFIEIAVEIILVAGAVILKIYTPPGTIAQALTKTANKPEEQLDTWGRTIPGNK